MKDLTIALLGIIMFAGSAVFVSAQMNEFNNDSEAQIAHYQERISRECESTEWLCIRHYEGIISELSK